MEATVNKIFGAIAIITLLASPAIAQKSQRQMVHKAAQNQTVMPSSSLYGCAYSE
jgi:hypothetical protein